MGLIVFLDEAACLIYERERCRNEIVDSSGEITQKGIEKKFIFGVSQRQGHLGALCDFEGLQQVLSIPPEYL